MVSVRGVLDQWIMKENALMRLINCYQMWVDMIGVDSIIFIIIIVIAFEI